MSKDGISQWTEAPPPGFVPQPEDNMKGFVRIAKHSPGLKNAVDVGLNVGDRITYQLGTGETVGAVVKSELRRHTFGAYGYECLFDDTDELGFADERKIIGWDGKS